MSNLLNPPAIIFINDKLSQGVVDQLVKQLFITQIQTAEEFDEHIDGYFDDGYGTDGYQDIDDGYDGYADGYISDTYLELIRGMGERILVMRNLLDFTNRDKADIVLSYRGGLVYVETSKVGPLGKAIKLQNVYLRTLMNG